MIRKSDQHASVAVVEEDRGYHLGLVLLSAESGARFRFHGTGREALRAARSERNDFWLISLELPDMSGFDLFEMLRDRLRGSPVCLVARTYRADDELRAYRRGAAMYACRPVERAWLRQCLGLPIVEAAGSERGEVQDTEGTVRSSFEPKTLSPFSPLRLL